MTQCQEATVIPIWRTAIWKWGVCKWDILKHSISNWIKLIFNHFEMPHFEMSHLQMAVFQTVVTVLFFEWKLFRGLNEWFSYKFLNFRKNFGTKIIRITLNFTLRDDRRTKNFECLRVFKPWFVLVCFLQLRDLFNVFFLDIEVILKVVSTTHSI